MQHARDRVRELTARSRLLLPVEVVTDHVNRFLRGWAAYFRYGNSADQFDKINGYARMRMAWFITRRHRRSREFGWFVLNHGRDSPGLVDLTGTVVAPRPFRDWRGRPNASGERRR
jgi:RNA-directed DNA polymerase